MSLSLRAAVLQFEFLTIRKRWSRLSVRHRFVGCSSAGTCIFRSDDTSSSVSDPLAELKKRP